MQDESAEAYLKCRGPYRNCEAIEPQVPPSALRSVAPSISTGEQWGEPRSTWAMMRLSILSLRVPCRARELQCTDQSLVSGHEAIGNGQVHQFARATQLLGLQVGTSFNLYQFPYQRR